MTDGILLRETRGHIRILTINRPERSNAMSPELTEQLIDAFVDGGADPAVRVIVLTAVGDRAFCAGADLKARAEADADERLLVQVQRDLEVRASYSGYIERAHEEIERARAQQDMALPADLDYSALAGLSHEVRQRLTHIRPLTIGQAARVQGVTPVAISILLVHLRRRGARVA